MSWQSYGILILIGVYVVAVVVIAPYLVRKGRYKSTRIRTEYHRLLENLKTSLFVCIGILVLNALIFLPASFVEGSRQSFALLGIVELISTCILLFLHRYLSRLIANFEKSDT